ncbi:hypothetical protein ABPG72_021795 [Tetrahymena utriculariae]
MSVETSIQQESINILGQIEKQREQIRNQSYKQTGFKIFSQNFQEIEQMIIQCLKKDEVLKQGLIFLSFIQTLSKCITEKEFTIYLQIYNMENIVFLQQIQSQHFNNLNCDQLLLIGILAEILTISKSLTTLNQISKNTNNQISTKCMSEIVFCSLVDINEIDLIKYFIDVNQGKQQPKHNQNSIIIQNFQYAQQQLSLLPQIQSQNQKIAAFHFGLSVKNILESVNFKDQVQKIIQIFKNQSMNNFFKLYQDYSTKDEQQAQVKNNGSKETQNPFFSSTNQFEENNKNTNINQQISLNKEAGSQSNLNLNKNSQHCFNQNSTVQQQQDYNFNNQINQSKDNKDSNNYHKNSNIQSIQISQPPNYLHINQNHSNENELQQLLNNLHVNQINCYEQKILDSKILENLNEQQSEESQNQKQKSNVSKIDNLHNNNNIQSSFHCLPPNYVNISQSHSNNNELQQTLNSLPYNQLNYQVQKMLDSKILEDFNEQAEESQNYEQIINISKIISQYSYLHPQELLLYEANQFFSSYLKLLESGNHQSLLYQNKMEQSYINFEKYLNQSKIYQDKQKLSYLKRERDSKISEFYQSSIYYSKIQQSALQNSSYQYKQPSINPNLWQNNFNQSVNQNNNYQQIYQSSINNIQNAFQQQNDQQNNNSFLQQSYLSYQQDQQNNDLQYQQSYLSNQQKSMYQQQSYLSDQYRYINQQQSNINQSHQQQIYQSKQLSNHSQNELNQYQNQSINNNQQNFNNNMNHQNDLLNKDNQPEKTEQKKESFWSWKNIANVALAVAGVIMLL